MTLKEFLKSPSGLCKSQNQWAFDFGITNGYISQLANGSKIPGLTLALLIEDRTRGKVTCYDWGIVIPAR